MVSEVFLCIKSALIFIYRVKYREEQIQKKIEERKFLEDEKDLEEREREYRLERLREQVSKPFFVYYFEVMMWKIERYIWPKEKHVIC